MKQGKKAEVHNRTTHFSTGQVKTQRCRMQGRRRKEAENTCEGNGEQVETVRNPGGKSGK